MPIKTFQRKESKYVLPSSKAAHVVSSCLLVPDAVFPISHIVSIYFDTPSRDVIQKSLEKPKYKEKLRARFYGESPDTCFIELKKKLKGVVYKRRVAIPAQLFDAFASGQELSRLLDDGASWQDRQIAREIDAYRARFDDLAPAFAIAAFRKSFSAEDGVRVTVDDGIWYKELGKADAWRKVSEQAVMEIKAEGAYPLWLVNVLSAEKAYPGSFSKYGTAYKMASDILPEIGEQELPDGFSPVLPSIEAIEVSQACQIESEGPRAHATQTAEPENPAVIRPRAFASFPVARISLPAFKKRAGKVAATASR